MKARLLYAVPLALLGLLLWAPGADARGVIGAGVVFRGPPRQVETFRQVNTVSSVRTVQRGFNVGFAANAFFRPQLVVRDSFRSFNNFRAFNSFNVGYGASFGFNRAFVPIRGYSSFSGIYPSASFFSQRSYAPAAAFYLPPAANYYSAPSYCGGAAATYQGYSSYSAPCDNSAAVTQALRELAQEVYALQGQVQAQRYQLERMAAPRDPGYYPREREPMPPPR